MRNEVNNCFSEILHEIKQLQIKVLEFVEKEEAAALGKLGNSIQQSHNRLLSLEGDSLWLKSLLTNRSDEQFLQARSPLDQVRSYVLKPIFLPSHHGLWCYCKVGVGGEGRDGKVLGRLSDQKVGGNFLYALGPTPVSGTS